MNLPETITRLLDTLQLEYKETVAERRGSLVLHVLQSGEPCVLKIHIEDEDPLSVGKRELLQHEASILSQIPELTNGLYRAHGNTRGMLWLLLRPVEGREARLVVREAIQPAINGEASRRAINILLKVSGFYHRLYAGGYLHGDVQPSHTFIEEGGVTVIDWGLARRIGEPHPLYKGGFVYYVAPEVAKDMQAKADLARYDVRSEVYAIGSTLFTILTSELAIDFGASKQELRETPMPVKLERVIENHIRTFSDAGFASYPELETVLRRATATDPSDRFSNPSELHHSLQSLK